MVGLDRRSRIGWHERRTVICGLAEDGRILTQFSAWDVLRVGRFESGSF